MARRIPATKLISGGDNMVETPLNTTHEEIVEDILEESRKTKEVVQDTNQQIKQHNEIVEVNHNKGESKMSKINILPTGSMGACGYNPGACGYGGYGCGFPPFGLFGMFPGGFGGYGNYGHGYRGGDDCRGMYGMEASTQREIGMLSDNMNSRFNDVNDDVRTGRLEGAIGGIKGQLGEMATRQFEAALAAQKCCCDQEKTTLLGFKDLEKTYLQCCCEEKALTIAEAGATRAAIHTEACATREVIKDGFCCLEKRIDAFERRLVDNELRESEKARLKLENEISNLKQTDELKGAIYAMHARLDKMDR